MKCRAFHGQKMGRFSSGIVNADGDQADRVSCMVLIRMQTSFSARSKQEGWKHPRNLKPPREKKEGNRWAKLPFFPFPPIQRGKIQTHPPQSWEDDNLVLAHSIPHIRLAFPGQTRFTPIVLQAYTKKSERHAIGFSQSAAFQSNPFPNTSSAVFFQRWNW